MSEELVVIKVFTTNTEAELAKGCLVDAGILAVLQKDDAGGMYPFLQAQKGVRLLVPAGEEEDATELLNEAGI